MPVTKTAKSYLGVRYTVYTEGATSNSTRYYRVLELNRSRTGESNPKWRSQVKQGVQAATPMNGTHELCKLTPGKAYRIVEKGIYHPEGVGHYYDYFVTVEGQCIAPFSALSRPSIDPSKANRDALSRLYSALRQQRTSMQAGVTAGELRETIKGVGDVAASLARLFGSHRRAQAQLIKRYVGSFRIDKYGNPERIPDLSRRFKSLEPTTWAKLQKELRDGWLQFSLGIRPMVKDVKDLAETLARWKFDYSHLKIRGQGEDVQGYPDSTVTGFEQSIKYYQFTQTSVSARVIYRAALSPDFDSPAFGSAHRLYTLLGAYDLENWVPTVWNLLPWSFVIDYVTNVADVVTSWVTDTSRVLWVVKTTVKETRQRVTTTVPYMRTVAGVIDGVSYYATQSGDLGGYELTTREVTRSPMGGHALPVMDLSFNLPSTKGLAIPNLIALFSGQPPKHIS